MTDRRWTSPVCTALALALLAALPAAAPASPAERAVAPAMETGLTIVACCSVTYCCEIMESSECDGTKFGSLGTCAMRCSLC